MLKYTRTYSTDRATEESWLWLQRFKFNTKAEKISNLPGSLGDYDIENRRENGKVRAYQNPDTGTILPIANQLIPDILVKTLVPVCFFHIRNLGTHL